MKTVCPQFVGYCVAISLALVVSSQAEPPARKARNPARLIDAGEVAEQKLWDAREALKEKDYARAETLYAEVLSGMDLEGAAMTWLNTQTSLCHILTLEQKKEEAILRAQRVVETCETQLGMADPITNEALNYLGSLLRQNGRLSEAEPVYRRNLKSLEQKYGANHFFVAKAATRLGALLHSLDRCEEAESLHRRAVRVIQSSTGGSQPDACVMLTNLAECLLGQGKTEEATVTMEEAFRIARSTSDGDLPSVGTILRRQAEFYHRLHQLDRAEELARRALLRLANRNDSDRAKYVYYDAVKQIFSAILRDRGLTPGEITAQIHALETSRQSASVD